MTTKKSKRAAQVVFGGKLKPTKKTYFGMCAPDRRIFVFKGDNRDFYFHVVAKNNHITAAGEGYRNLSDLAKELIRLWPHFAIMDDGINDA